MRTSFFSFLFLALVLSFSVFAQEKELTINADIVSFDKDKSQVEATGSVEVVYKDVMVNGCHIIYNTSQETITADKGFTLNHAGISIEGETLNYLIKSKTGEATDIAFVYRGIELRGKKIQIGLDKLKINEASFTTCDLTEPHYHVTAGEITLYPDYGWLVAYWGYFWLGRFPVVPMPTYIYDLTAEEKAKKNLPPFPDIGANDEDGTYLNERLAWHIKREFSGTYSLTYATKKGLGGGAEANYIVNDDNRGNLRTYGNVTDGLWGGITHHVYFGEDLTARPETPFSFIAAPKYRRYELETTLSYRERINYQRVSFYPSLAMRSRKLELFRPELKLDAELLAGVIKEENSVNLMRGGGVIGLSWDFPEAVLGKITPALSLDARYYSNGSKWEKTGAGVDLRKSFMENVTFGLGYFHYFSVNGQSPFLFEMYRFRPADRLGSDLFFMVGETGIGISTSYFLDTWQAEDIDYSLFFRMHCYNLLAKYRSLRREFELGFSLAGGY